MPINRKMGKEIIHIHVQTKEYVADELERPLPNSAMTVEPSGSQEICNSHRLLSLLKKQRVLRARLQSCPWDPETLSLQQLTSWSI